MAHGKILAKSVVTRILATKSLSWYLLDRISLAGHVVTTASRAQLSDAMQHDCLAAQADGFTSRPRLVFDVNGHGISLARQDSYYRAAVDAADILHADGGFLVTLSRWKAPKPIAERSATTDLLHDFAHRAEQRGLTFYLLGGTEEVNADCASTLESLYPKLKIVGRRNGYFSEADEAQICADISKLQPDVVWVGLGKPKEQYFALRNADKIRAGWLVTCGGCFNYVTGHYSRAPQWMQAANIEWLHRMATNPKQLFWRYLITTPHALWITLRARQSN